MKILSHAKKQAVNEVKFKEVEGRPTVPFEVSSDVEFQARNTDKEELLQVLLVEKEA